MGGLVMNMIATDFIPYEALVVEYNNLLAEQIANRLNARGFSVKIADSLDEVTNLVGRHRFDLVVYSALPLASLCVSPSEFFERYRTYMGNRTQLIPIPEHKRDRMLTALGVI